MLFSCRQVSSTDLALAYDARGCQFDFQWCCILLTWKIELVWNGKELTAYLSCDTTQNSGSWSWLRWKYCRLIRVSCQWNKAASLNDTIMVLRCVLGHSDHWLIVQCSEAVWITTVWVAIYRSALFPVIYWEKTESYKKCIFCQTNRWAITMLCWMMVFK